MAPEQVVGKNDNKKNQQGIDDQRGGSRIYPADQRQTGDQFHERDDDGDWVDQNCRKEIIAIDDLGKIRRCEDFVVTCVYKGQT